MEGLGITSDAQLLKIAKQLNVEIAFIGFVEEFGEKLPLGFSIINLGDDFVGGTHWTLLYVSKDEILYLDSFGQPPEDRIIELAEGRPLNYNKKQVQGIYEEFCGVWALLFANVIQKAILGKKNIHRAINDFLNQFKSVELVAIANKSLEKLRSMRQT